MGMSTRGPLPLLICSRGVGLQEKYHIRLHGKYSIWITISDQIYLYLQDIFWKPCGVRQSVPCATCLDVVSWTVPDSAAHVPRRE